MRGRTAAVAFVTAMGGGAGLAATYWRGGQPQLEGVFLALLLGGMGIGVVSWARHLMPNEAIEEARPLELASSEPDRTAVAAELESRELIHRRRFLGRLLGGAVATAVVAFAFPVRSLGPRPGRSLFHTAWRRGLRAVREDGTPVRAGELQAAGVLTVFPEGHTDAADSQALLIRLQSGDLVCYSKVCTHLGCPVGLYQARTHLLLCPCHQSTFDVLRGARPRFGPATRPLPRLPVAVDGDGFVRALGDFPEAVGPGFWNRGR